MHISSFFLFDTPAEAQDLSRKLVKTTIRKAPTRRTMTMTMALRYSRRRICSRLCCSG